ncbi:MAG: PilZ domain-containing protein [Clostridiales bacterium]|nr:PilZ domain-containing protein [Clostridiales bacterium]
METIQISDFLEKESVLKTQVQDSIEWIPNVVVDLHPDTEEIDLIFDDRYSNSVVLVGDAVKLNYVEEKVQYIVDAWITGIRMQPTKIMTLKVVSIKQMANLRKDERYSVNYGATISSFDNPTGVFGVITNISLSGLGVIVRQMFLVGDIVKISIHLPSSSFVVDAEIVRSSETPKGTEYGVSFVRHDEEALEELTSLIEDIKEREDRLSRIVGFNII